MMTAFILGVVEGITEFLPISSTGHLVLVNQFFSFSSNTFTTLFDVIIQLGAILSVVVYFRKRLWPFGDNKSTNTQTKQLWIKTIIAVIPALILGALFSDFITRALFNPFTVAITLIVGGIVLIIVEYNPKTAIVTTTEDIGVRTALGIGLAQCIALIPGVSRSGATIVGGLILGVSRVVATEFSFFLAIPTMLAASGYALFKHGSELSINQGFVIGVGFIVSFLVALGVIKFFMSYIQKHDFKLFGYYRIALGIVILFLLT